MRILHPLQRQVGNACVWIDGMKQTCSVEIVGELRKAVDDLYRVFGIYLRPKWFVGCACCWTEGEPVVAGSYQGGSVRVAAPGGSRPLQTLTAGELREFASNVPHLGGDSDVLKHYLPRLFEILITTGFNWPDFEPLIGRLNFGADKGGVSWWTWPDEEQLAVNKFFQQAWARCLAEPVDLTHTELSVDELLCGIGTVVFDVQLYLEKWLRFDEPFSARHLEVFLSWNNDLFNGRLTNPFWNGETFRAATNIRGVVRWAHAQPTLLRVLDALDQDREQEEKDALTECFSLLTGGDSFGASHLEQMVASENTLGVSALLAAGVDPNELDSVTSKLIWQIAFESGKYQIASVFLSAGAEVDRVDNRGLSLLHRLVSSGASVKEIGQILADGASVDLADRHGWTPLHNACAHGYLEAVKVLLAAGANTNAVTKDGKTPRAFASLNNHHKVLTLL
jgi:hypothetical protein